MVKSGILAGAVLIAGLFLQAADQPGVFRVQRSATIEAPRERVHALVEDLRRSDSWKRDLTEPFEGRNAVEFTLSPRGASTEVTWAMHGPRPFVARLINVFVDMDGMIGRDFEAGLADLKAAAEAQAGATLTSLARSRLAAATAPPES